MFCTTLFTILISSILSFVILVNGEENSVANLADIESPSLKFLKAVKRQNSGISGNSGDSANNNSNAGNSDGSGNNSNNSGNSSGNNDLPSSEDDSLVDSFISSSRLIATITSTAESRLSSSNYGSSSSYTIVSDPSVQIPSSVVTSSSEPVPSHVESTTPWITRNEKTVWVVIPPSNYLWEIDLENPVPTLLS